MATKKGGVRRTARRAYVPRKKKSRRRTSYVNKNPTKPLALMGAGVGVAGTLAPVAIAAIQNRSGAPVKNAIMSPNTYVEGGKNAIVGYAAGYGLGYIINKSKIGKKPINKVLKKVGIY